MSVLTKIRTIVARNSTGKICSFSYFCVRICNKSQCAKMPSVKLPIYLDNNSTTVCDPRVVDAMLPYFTEKYGNSASGSHVFGWQAHSAVESARRTIAHTLGAVPSEIVFTSGATESDNLAIKGAALSKGARGKHIITAATEHKAVLDSCNWLASNGFEVTMLAVDEDGFVSLDELFASIRNDTILVSIMHGNNEIGTIQNIAEIGKITRDRGALFHTDATQTIGKIPFNTKEVHVDMASLTAHKLYGPKGVGALYVRSGCQLAAQMHGGGQESGSRSGTLNVPGIAGLAKACEISLESMNYEIAHCRKLRDILWKGIQSLGVTMQLNGPDPLLHPDKRLPGNLNVGFETEKGRQIARNLEEVAFSAGSACSSGKKGASHVLQAIGRQKEEMSSFRFGVGRFTTEEEIDYILDCMRRAL